MKKMRNRLLVLMTEKEKKEKRRIRQYDIAKAIGVSPNTITNWLKDDFRQLDTVILLGLCDYFGVTFDQMLYVEETDDPADTSHD